VRFSRDSIWFQGVFLGSSLALCLAAVFIFSVQPDVCAAVLVLPRWMWVLPGTLLALLAFTRKRKWMSLAVVTLWLLYGLVFSQELRSLVRWKPADVRESAGKSGLALRVISLNCNGGNEKAAAEVSAYRPDLVFSEESPLRPVLQSMATNLLGPEAESICGSDVSIIARGKLTQLPVENPESAPFAHARVRFSSGLVAEVFVVRLQPYDIRGDLWSPECWRRQYAVRKKQRGQFEWIEREVGKVPKDVPIILGGDFNLPAGDTLFEGLRARLADTFRQSGRGWGDTLDNDWPVLRIDQIWCDEHFSPLDVQAHHTENSDHRMVVCDLISSPTR
jgi:endonuclease/exonuclease/phosphatase (EEP) superfamily protein YafD